MIYIKWSRIFPLGGNEAEIVIKTSEPDKAAEVLKDARKYVAKGHKK